MSTRPDRETAYRVFAAEFEDANYSYAESDEERAPNYVVTPTGVRANRLFAVGVLTEIETVGGEQLRARVVDPTGAFVVYAGQYQPEALSFLEATTPPAFVAVTGKVQTFQPEDSNRIFTSVRPETMSEVDAETRDRFTVDTAERTTERIGVMRDALARDERGDELRAALENEDIEIGLAGVPRAIEHYRTTPAYLDAVERMALDAARVVAGEREEVRPLSTAPGEGGQSEDSTTRTATADAEGSATEEPAAPTPTPGSGAETGTDLEAETADDVTAPEEAEKTADTEPTPDSVTGTGSPDETNESAIESTDELAADTETEGNAGDGTDLATDEAETEPPATDSESDEFEDPEEFELDDDVREHIEETYGTDFETASEVDDPGKADIETPTPEADGSMDAEDQATSDEPIANGETESEPGVESAETDAETRPDKPSAEPDEATADDSDIDPETAVLDAMATLDDGDGAERAAIEERVAEEYELTPEEADDGIQQALMSGECYESDDDTFTPI